MNNNYQNGRRSGAPVRSQTNERLPQQKGGAVVQLSGRALRQKQKDDQWKREDKKLERVRHGIDRPMLAILFTILLLGSIMVFSASFPSAYILTKDHDSFHFIKNHLIYAGIGCAAMFGMSFLPINFYKKFTPALYLFSIFLLILVFFVGTSEGVAKRWIFIGSQISFQPSELAKAAVILMLAWYFDKNYEKVNNPIDKKSTIVDGVLKPAVIMGIICVLVIAEKHLSGTMIIAMIAVCVIFLGGAHIGYTIGIYLTAGITAFGLFLAIFDYARERVSTFFSPEADVLGADWQTTQGLYAIGSGGFLGVGLGDSRLKYNYVSEPQNDFIFTIWCEEMGFIGAVIVIFLYALFIWRGFTIAKKAPDTYSSLVAFGITCQVGIQAFLNMMVVTDLMFNTGISLPFFSYGGSSLLILLCEMGILFSISRHSYQKK